MENGKLVERKLKGTALKNALVPAFNNMEVAKAKQPLKKQVGK